MNLKDLIKEDKNSLKAEYEKLKKQSFPNKETLQRMEETQKLLLKK